MTALKVLETNILHASDVIYWVDGTTASSEDNMLRLLRPLIVKIKTGPSDLQILNAAGKTALWRRSDGIMVDGMADESDKAFPAASPYDLTGTAYDPEGRYNPRTFSISAGAAGGHTLVLLPSPFGASLGKAGGLIGTLRWNGSQDPVPWAILSLEVTTDLGAPLVFRSQADGSGDFKLSMKQLPPLPEGIDHYAAVLTIEALADADADMPIDPDELLSMTLGDLETADTFSTGLDLQVVPGEIRLLRSLNKDYLSVKPN
jgi:hypothetical protein